MGFQVSKFIHAVGTDISFLLINALLSSFSLLFLLSSSTSPFCSHHLLSSSAHLSCPPSCPPLLPTSPSHLSCSPSPLLLPLLLLTSPAHLSHSALSSCTFLYFCTPPLLSSLFLIYSTFFPALLSHHLLLSGSVFHSSPPHFMKYLFSIVSTSLFKRKSMLESVMPLARFITGNVMCFLNFSTLPRLVTTSL